MLRSFIYKKKNPKNNNTTIIIHQTWHICYGFNIIPSFIYWNLIFDSNQISINISQCTILIKEIVIKDATDRCEIRIWLLSWKQNLDINTCNIWNSNDKLNERSFNPDGKQKNNSDVTVQNNGNL